MLVTDEEENDPPPNQEIRNRCATNSAFCGVAAQTGLPLILVSATRREKSCLYGWISNEQLQSYHIVLTEFKKIPSRKFRTGDTRPGAARGGQYGDSDRCAVPNSEASLANVFVWRGPRARRTLRAPAQQMAFL